LDPETAARIAAGEIIERPASVVKELVENAVDAAARRIEVHVTSRPDWQAVVRDDGDGIPAEEVELAFARHATSKLTGVEDLRRISTLGFRGEALPSIAAVAEVEMLTRPAGAAGGTRVRVRGGKVQERVPWPCAPGTRVTVSDLFFNLPVRRGALADPGREGLNVAETVARLALAHPDRAFSLAADGRLVFRAPGRGDLLGAVAAVWGSDLAREMMPVEGESGRLQVRGYLGRPGVGRADRRRQLLVVNGRPVVSQEFSRLLERLYAGQVPHGKHPVAVLHLLLPPEQVDANVHPAKLTVRLLSEEEIWEAVYRCLRPALETSSGPSRAVLTPPASGVRRGESGTGMVHEVDPGKMQVYDAGLRAGPFEPEVLFLPPLEPIGQLAATYILAQAGGELYIIDQHAAHERIRYTELGRREQTGGATQLLTAPLSRQLAPQETELFWRHAEVFRRLGYLAERFGPAGILFRGLPAGLPSEDSLRVLEEVLSSLAQDRGAEAELAERTRKALACRGAIKANQYLDLREMSMLLEELRRVPQPYTCPHGRPAILRFSREELARAFARR
jgi:DNA mismatch repair protein MutL